MKRTLSLFFFFFLTLNIFSQEGIKYAEIDEKISNYSIDKIDVSKIINQLSEHDFNNISLKFGNVSYEMEIYSSGVISDNFVAQSSTGEKQNSLVKTFKGSLKGIPESSVRLSFNDNFIMGQMEIGDNILAIQPAWYYDKNLDRDLFVSYFVSDLIEDKEVHSCEEVNEEEEILEQIRKQRLVNSGSDDTAALVGLCFEVDIALASDFAMFVKYGSVTGVTNHIIGVLNNVQTNYDTEFADELEFVVATTFIVNTAGGDPWTASTNAGTLLGSFRAWGPGGFGAVHDVATLWTNRNFNGSTVGIAYLNAVCTGSRYNCCQDYSSTAWALRVLQSHELGHNFAASHDGGGGFIMSPSVNNTNTWSANSINQIQNHYLSRICLSNCAPAGPPNALFEINITTDCAPGVVQYTDLSSNNPTSWSWVFPGGTPATSTLQHPVVTYINAGSYNATLTASNALGSDNYTLPNNFDILDVPLADFVFQIIFPTTVVFTDISLNGTSWFWDFGDGTTSTLQNPVHVYAAGGTFFVTLIVTNSCGSDTKVKSFFIDVLPVVDFDSNLTTGCEPLTVNFNDLTTNLPISWTWTFEGGTPVSSTDQNPIVTYLEPGVYDVMLEITNPYGGDMITKVDYITVDPLPIADFSSTTNGAEVTFTNNSTADSYLWEFGDGNTSTEINPVHTYAAEGTYMVTLTASNNCGDDVFTESVIITLVPTASFSSVQNPGGCVSFTIDFLDTSTNSPDTWSWTFPGGNPSTSTDQNPIVVYDFAGMYDVTLEVSNAQGTDMVTMNDYVIIDDIPTASFTYSSSLLEFSFMSMMNNADSFIWDFGDGNMSSEMNPVHTYVAEGSYTVTLTTTNNCGDFVVSMNIVAVNLPVADYTVDQNIGCIPFTVQFTDNSTPNVTSWNWSFPGGTPSSSTDQNPVIVYNTIGLYDVTLEVTAPGGTDMITVMNEINVMDGPVIDYSINLVGNTIELTNNTPNSTATWTVSDGANYAENTATHTFAENGNYTIDLIVTNACGEDQTTIDVSITAYPTASFGANILSGCLPLSVDFQNNSTEGTSYLWTFEGGNPATSMDENPTVIFEQVGNYTVSLVTSNQYGDDLFSEVDLIIVVGPPTASFESVANGSTIQLTNTSTEGVSYLWDFGDGETSTDENPSHQYVNTGTYTITLEVTNDCGTTSFSEEIEMIFTTPGIDVAFSVTSGCLPLIVEITDMSTNNPTSWEWTFDGGSPSNSTDQNPVVTYNAVGVYSVSVIVSNVDGSSSITFIDAIEVIDVPSAGFTALDDSGTVKFTNESTGANSYLWDFGDGQTSTEENPTHIYTQNGTYSVVLTAINECGETTETMDVIVMVSATEDLDLSDKFVIYPNPSKGSFIISFEESLVEDGNLEIIDMLGRKIVNNIILPKGVKKKVIDGLKVKGTHIIIIKSGSKRYVKKLIVI